MCQKLKNIMTHNTCNIDQYLDNHEQLADSCQERSPSNNL